MPREDLETMKKVAVEDEDDDRSLKRKVKSPANITSAAKSMGKVKKEVSVLRKEEDDGDSEEPTSKRGSNKTDITGKKKKKKKKMKTKGGEKDVGEGGKKREKKVFDLPGQKREAPDERDPLRIFYETLYHQSPASEMAATWMMESGLLPKDAAKKVFDRKQSEARQQRLSSPMETVVSAKRNSDDSLTISKKSATSPVRIWEKKQSKKRKKNDHESSKDDDFVVNDKRQKKPPISHQSPV